jgi:hypothetical protein
MKGIHDRRWVENAYGSGFLCIYKLTAQVIFDS